MRHIKSVIFYISVTSLILLASLCGGCAQSPIHIESPEYSLSIDEGELKLEMGASVEIDGGIGGLLAMFGFDRSLFFALTVDLETGEPCGSVVVFGFEVVAFEPCAEVSE